MEQVLIFKTEEVSATSGAVGVFKASALESFSVTQAEIRLIFNESQTAAVTGPSSTKPFVTLKVRPGNEYKSAIALTKFLQTDTSPIIFFDNIREQFPINNILSVGSISSVDDTDVIPSPQNFPMSFETQLTSGNYFYGNRRYGWNYVAWTNSDADMQLDYFELTSAMVAINDYTAISVEGIAGSMLTSNSITIEFSLWKGTNAGGTGTFSTTQITSTTVGYDTNDEMKPLSFGATGLTINEGDYIFLAVRNPSYSVQEDIACSITVTFS